MRVVPVGDSILPDQKVQSYENIEEWVKKAQRSRAVMPCGCRTFAQARGEGCGKPMETCLCFGPYAEYNIKNGYARKINDDEFRMILKTGKEAGLVLLTVNSRDFINDPVWMCMCCDDCCMELAVINKFHAGETIDDLGKVEFIASVDEEKCSGCEVCIDWCHRCRRFD